MTRTPYARLTPKPPYVARHEEDTSFFAAAEAFSWRLLVRGLHEEAGVSRALKQFHGLMPEYRFDHPRDRHLVVFDVAQYSYLLPAEYLAVVRNALVELVNGEFGFTTVGFDLAEFDVLYSIWLKKEYGGRIDEATKLRPTLLKRTGQRIVRFVISFGVGTAIEFIGLAHELAELSERIGWDMDPIPHEAGDQGVEAVIEHRFPSARDFLHRCIGPIASKRVKAALDPRRDRTGTGEAPELGHDHIVELMRDALIDAIGRFKAKIEKKGSFVLAADAIDMLNANDDGGETELWLDDGNSKRRDAIAGLLLNSATYAISSIFCGRELSRHWLDQFEFQTDDEKALDKLLKVQIRQQLAPRYGDRIEAILAMVGDKDTVLAGHFSKAWDRWHRENPPQ